MRRYVIICAALLIFVACGKRPAGLASLLPASAGGWTREGGPRTFAASELWRYMNGAADHYVKAGVQQTATADYRRGEQEAVVDLHRFVSPEAARSVMESEVAAGEPLSLGDAGRVFAQGVVFRRGVYLVRLTAYQNTPDTRAAITALARAINQRL
ncbi:MAG: DUF6599 family protein [Terriglobales bacterium]